MEPTEGNADRYQDNSFPDDGEQSDGHQPSFSSESGHPEEPTSDSEEIELPRNQWGVEVVSGHAPDAADRMSRAIEILLNAAPHPKQ